MARAVLWSALLLARLHAADGFSKAASLRPPAARLSSSLKAPLAGAGTGGRWAQLEPAPPRSDTYSWRATPTDGDDEYNEALDEVREANERLRAAQERLATAASSSPPPPRPRPLGARSTLDRTDAGTLLLTVPASGVTGSTLMGGAFSAAWFSAIAPATLAAGSIAAGAFFLPFWLAGGLMVKQTILDPAKSTSLTIGEYAWELTQVTVPESRLINTMMLFRLLVGGSRVLVSCGTHYMLW